MSENLSLPISIAPMIDWTYNHFRVLMRFLAPKSLLYTEMQTTGAIRNNPKRALEFSVIEHPLAIQLGGSDKNALVECAKIAEQAGFVEINLNLGCPSDKVQAGRFGACLMTEPEHVADCLYSMKQAVTIPVTAKIRTGIDNQDSYEFFRSFAHRLAEAGTQKIIVHARKAWLNGLNPKQNRTIPPVQYDFVYQLKQELSAVPIIINGNILNISEIMQHLTQVDGVMLGRLACDNPWKIAEIHQALYPEIKQLTRSQLFTGYKHYLIEAYQKGEALSHLVKPIFNFAFGLPGARQWKKHLMNLLQVKDLTLLNSLSDYLLEMEAIKESAFPPKF